MANLNTILAAAQEDDSLRVMLEQRLDTDARLHGLSASGPSRQAIIEQIAHETYSAYTGGNPDRDTTLSERSAMEDFARGLGLGVREGPSNLIRRGVTGQGVPDFWVDEPDLGLSGKIGRELGTFLDPLTWVGFGVGGKIVSKGAQIAGRKLVQKGVQTAGRKAAMGLARNRAGQALAGALELAANPAAMRKSAAPLSRKLIASSLQGAGQLAGHAAVTEGAGQLAARDLDLGQLGKRVGTSALTGAAVLGPAVAVKNPIARYIAEAVAFPAVGGALEGHLPTEDDFIASFAVLGALKSFNAIGDMRAKRALSKKKGERTPEEQKALDKLKSESPEKIKTLRDEAIGGVVEEARSVAQRMGIPQEQAMKSLRKALGSEREHLLDDYLKGEATGEVKGQRVYREMSLDRALELHPATVADTPFGAREEYFSTSRELALGQGKNRGVTIEFFDDFGATPARTKPGAQIVEASGGGGERVAKVQPSRLKKSIRSITLDPKTAEGGRAATMRFNNWMKTLEKEGWERTENQDGTTTWSSGEARSTTEAATPRVKPTQQQMASLKGLAHRLGKDAEGKVEEWSKRGEATATEVEEMIEILRADGAGRRPPPKGEKPKGEDTLRDFEEAFSEKAAREMPTIDDIVDKTFDDLMVLKQIRERIEKTKGVDLSEEGLNFEYEARAARGWAGDAENWIRNNLRPVFVGLSKGEQFLAAKLAAAYNVKSKPKFFDKTQLRQMDIDPESVDAFIAKHSKTPTIEQAARDMIRLGDELLKYTVGEDSATYQRIKAKGYEHVSMYRDLAGKIEAGGFHGNMLDIFEPIFGQKGGGEKAQFINPLEGLTKNIYGLIRAKHHARVAEQLVDAVEKFGLEGILERVKPGEKRSSGEAYIQVRRPQEALGLGLEGESAGQLRDFVTYRFKPGKEGQRLFRALSSLEREPLNGVLKLMGIPARWLRAGAILNFEFAFRNPVRDMFSAHIQAKYGFNPADYVRGIYSFLKKDEFFEIAEREGGMMAHMQAMDRVGAAKGFAEATAMPKGVFGTAGNMLIHPIHHLRLLSELSEYGTRIGVLRRSLRKGASMQEAINEMRRNPVDYQQGGEYFNNVNAIVAFFKANMLGMQRLQQSFKERPVQTMGRVAASVTVPSVLLTLHNRKDPRWDDIPDWQKNAFWIVMTPDHVFRIPKPFDWGMAFGSVPERITEWILDKDESQADAIKDALTSQLPSLMPTALVPAWEAISNYDMFRDASIVPRSKQDLPEFMQTKSWSGPTVRALGKTLGVSPAKLEHLWRGYTAGLGRYVTDTADWTLERVMSSPTGEKPAGTVADIPGLRAFGVRYPSASGKQVSDFYDKSTEVDRLWKARKMLRFNAQQLAQVEAMHAVGAQTRKQLIALRKQADTVEDSVTMSATDKRRRLDTLYKRMSRISRMANKRLRMLDRLEIHSKRLAIRDSFQRF